MADRTDEQHRADAARARAAYRRRILRSRGSGSNETKSTIGDTGTARRFSFPQKTYL